MIRLFRISASTRTILGPVFLTNEEFSDYFRAFNHRGIDLAEHQWIAYEEAPRNLSGMRDPCA